MIGHFKNLILLQSFNNHRQILFAIRNLFKQDFILDAHAVQHQIADGECIVEPASHRAIFQFISILDKVTVLPSLLVLYDEAKHFLDGDAPFVEGTKWKWLPFAHIVVNPLAVDVLVGDSLRLVDSIYQPDVLVQ